MTVNALVSVDEELRQRYGDRVFATRIRENVRVGDNEVVDDTAQMNWIQTLVDRVNAKLNSAEEAPAPAEEDDLPEEFAE